MNTADSKGGAERIVLNLHSYYSKLGHESYVAVDRKSSNDDSILQIPWIAPAKLHWGRSIDLDWRG